MKKIGPPLLLLALALATGSPGHAQEGSPGASGDIGWHIIRPGDTMIRITERYLGSSTRWRDNWRLNPEVPDPNRLEPGQRIRVFLSNDGERAAAITKVARRVEEKPQPIPWIDAQEGDILRQEDGLRTYPRSSAELAFTDGTRLRLTEDSLVFLRPRASARSVGGGTIEIVEGQADLEATGGNGPGPAAGIEIVLGATRALPEPDASGTLQTRARRPDSGGAQVMVYDGKSQVEAAGEQVEVGRGMGTSVPEAGPPEPPEELLAAPADLAPAAGVELAFANPILTWQPISGASSYTVELCSDPECGRLVDRQMGLTEPRWAPERLPVGAHFWRVRGVAGSGLDGYASPSTGLTITSDNLDNQAPTGEISIFGPHFRVACVLYFGPETHLEARGTDAQSGFERWRLLLDGSEVREESWSRGWVPGKHTAEAVAVDRVGNRASVAPPLAFIMDIEPPSFDFETGGLDLIETWGAPEAANRKTLRKPKRLWHKASRGEEEPVLLWSSDGRKWVPIPWNRAPGDPTWSLDFVRPHLFLQTGRRDVILAGGPERVTTEEVLRIWSEDDGCGVRSLVLVADWTPGPERQRLLRFETEDCVGNRREVEWPVEVARGRG